MEVEIRLIEKEKLRMIIPLLARLNPKIPVDILECRLAEMKCQGYECVGIFDKNKLVGISGIWLLTKYYIGKHIEPDNVYILPEYRKKGLGERLMKWIFEYAKSKGCSASELNCYVKNEAGQRFWKRQGYEILGYHYQKQL